MATNQISVADLNVAQLADVKRQIETELEHFTNSFNSLRGAQAKFNACINSVREIREENKAKPILVPLTNSLYVPGKLTDAENVLVDVGTGYYVKKTRPQAIKYYQGKVEVMKRNLEALEENITKRRDTLGSIEGVLQSKLQEQQRAGGAKAAS